MFDNDYLYYNELYNNEKINNIVKNNNCKNVEELFNLTEIQLDYYCPFILTFMTKLKILKMYHIKKTINIPISLINLEYISAIDCGEVIIPKNLIKIKSINIKGHIPETLIKAEEIKIVDTDNIVIYGSFINLNKLIFENCNNIRVDISNVDLLTFSNCQNIHIEDVKYVKLLKLANNHIKELPDTYCENIFLYNEDIEEIVNREFKYVKCRYCDEIKTISNMPKLETLECYDCVQLRELNNFPKLSFYLCYHCDIKMILDIPYLEK